MTIRKKLIIANWKAYLTDWKSVGKYFAWFSKIFRAGKSAAYADVVICPPTPFLAQVTSYKLQDAGYALGAQNVFWEQRGAYTGEATPAMLADLGVSRVIIGHSERRRHLGETDEMVQKKVSAALAAKLKPVICVGEWTRATSDEEEKKNLDFMKTQITKALAEVKKPQMKKVAVAYEPVWAITGTGTGVADTPENAAAKIMFVRRILAKLYDAKTAKATRIIYGGSVSSQNAAAFLREESVDGVLVGSASANAEEFLKIVKCIPLPPKK